MSGERQLRGQVYRGAILVMFAVVIVNLFGLQVIKHRDYKARSVENRQVRTRVRAPRGRILDRDGAVLADNVYIADITVPAASLGRKGRSKPDSTLDRLLTWLALPREETLARLADQRDRGYGRVVLVENATMAQIAAVEERKPLVPRAQVEARSRRRYPYGPLLAHVIGYVAEVNPTDIDTVRPAGDYAPGDLIGKAGIEAARDRRLRGRAGTRIEEVNASGRVVGRAPYWLNQVVAGGDLRLTLSLALQETLAAAMAGRPGCAVALELPSGDVLSAYSGPSFDPNPFTTGVSSAEWQRLRDDPERPLFNRIAQATYPPGSPYKIVTTLTGLMTGAAGEHTAFNSCRGGYQFGNRFYRCWKHEGHGGVDHEQALIKSCDTFYYQLGLHLDIDDMRRSALALGLGQKCGSPFSAESAGNIPSSAYYDRKFGRRRWSRGVMLNNAIGQGEILVTPLQMALMMARVATSGRVARPHFTFDEPHGSAPTLPFGEENLAWVRDTLGKVVEMGTGTAARLKGINVGGKTGTAQNPHGNDHAWFICFAPVEAPKVAMAVILENAGHGGTQAAPVAARWMAAYFEREAHADSLAAARQLAGGGPAGSPRAQPAAAAGGVLPAGARAGRAEPAVRAADAADASDADSSGSSAPPDSGGTR